MLHIGYGVATRPRAIWMVRTAGTATQWLATTARSLSWRSVMLIACGNALGPPSCDSLSIGRTALTVHAAKQDCAPGRALELCGHSLLSRQSHDMSRIWRRVWLPCC